MKDKFAIYVPDRSLYRAPGKASDMVTVARLSSHYETMLSKEHDAMEVAIYDFNRFKRVAPELWQRLYSDSKLSDREIGDWLFEFFLRHSRSKMSLKNFAADELEAMEKNGK